MTAWDRLVDLQDTPSKMTALHWVLWNSRANLPRKLLERAAQELEKLLEAK